MNDNTLLHSAKVLKNAYKQHAKNRHVLHTDQITSKKDILRSGYFGPVAYCVAAAVKDAVIIHVFILPNNSFSFMKNKKLIFLQKSKD